MSLMDFIKGKITYILSIGTMTFLSILILCALQPAGGPALSILIGGLFVIGGFAPLVYEYLSKRPFYQNLLAVYDALDRKNLIAEMISPPGFMEGNILYELLQGCNKAMLEEINTYRFRGEEYREYMELWVHEIKTPIASSRLIAQNNESEAMESLSEELSKIETFIEQVLYYSRSNTVEKDYIIREISLKKLCYEVLRKNAKLFIHNRISVNTETLEYNVYSDNKWLEFILGQILTNSVKYADKDNACIRLWVEKKDNSRVLIIEDNGVGIKENELPKIFDKGFTGTNGRKNERSTGMGLYICKKLCDKLGLGMEAASVFGQGTRISLVFPLNSTLLSLRDNP